MEVETEKSSYTLNHNGEEHDESKTETYEPFDEERSAETDKMLEKVAPAVKKSTEVLAEVTESTALAEKSEAVKEPEVSPSAEVPIKNRFLQFFDRKKNKSEPATETANGNGSAVDGKTEPAAAVEPVPKRRFIPIKLQNPFAKKNENGEGAPAIIDTKPTIEASSSDEKKGEKSQNSTFNKSIQLSTFNCSLQKNRPKRRKSNLKKPNSTH